MANTQRGERALPGHDAFQRVAPTRCPETGKPPPQDPRGLATRRGG
jgi:hypothetical protein